MADKRSFRIRHPRGPVKNAWTTRWRNSQINLGWRVPCLDSAVLINDGVRQYLYIEQLAACTPWSPDAIRTMIARGTFKLGVHYFKPHGRNGRPIFSWDAIVRYIEQGNAKPCSEDAIPLSDGRVIDLDEATAKAHRLRG